MRFINTKASKIGLCIFFLLAVKTSYVVAVGKPILIVQRGHASGINALAFSPDGSVLASGSSDGTVKVWDMESGMILNTYEGHDGEVHDVAFSKDGSLIAFGTAGGTVMICAMNDGKCFTTAVKHSNNALDVEFSADGKFLVSGSSDRTIRLWSVKDGALLNTFTEPGGDAVFNVAFSSDGLHIASTGDKRIIIWEIRSGKSIFTFKNVFGKSSHLLFSPDGTRLLSGSVNINGDESVLNIWSVENGKLLNTYRFEHGDIYELIYDKSNEYIYAGYSNNRVTRINDFQGGVQNLPEYEGGAYDSIDCLAISPNKGIYAVGRYDKSISIISMVTGEEIKRLPGGMGEIRAVAISPDSKNLAYGGWDNLIWIWSLESGKLTRTLDVHTSMVDSIDFSHDGNIAASGSQDGKVFVWSPNTGKLIKSLEPGSAIFQVSFNRGGDSILVGASGGVGILNIEPVRLDTIASFNESGEMFNSATYGKNDELVAIGKKNETEVWSLNPRTMLKRMKGHVSYINSTTISSDGRYVASASNDQGVIIWSVETGKEKHRLRGSLDYVVAALFSPDGKYLISGGYDTNVSIWDVETGELMNTLKGHTDSVNSLAFGNYGNIIISGSSDSTVRIWDLQTGEMLSELYVFEDGEWLVVDSSQHFDCSCCDGVDNKSCFKKFKWRVDGELRPFEEYYKEYYQPNMLSKIFK